MGKLYNEYDLSGDYGIGYTHNTHEEFYFDLEDYPEICMYTWSENDGKIVTFDYPDGKRKKIHLSRIVMNVEDKEEVVKYYNGDTFDCRKSNLYITRFKKEKRKFYG